MKNVKKPFKRSCSIILSALILCSPAFALPSVFDNTGIRAEATDDTVYTSGNYQYKINDDDTATLTKYTG